MASNSNDHNSNISNIHIDDSQQPAELTEYPDSDTFRILIVTDTHLGHLERDKVRRYDSFRAFDEALSIGKQYNVDFVLHAGDLFDKNQPSRFTMVKTLHILRKHCLGNKPIHFQIVSDQSQNFPSTGRVNYQDPNYNISLPIFIQHGNHDDPAGLGNHAALEQLSATNLVNYIGRVDDLEDVRIFPVLMRKGSTKLAVYPLGYIRDERLHRAFLHHKVKWIKPKANHSNNACDWFNIAMIHQNRTRHTQQYKDCIPEEFLPKFLDIAYWGHEHECVIDLNESLTGNFFITQPGSTVITSLSRSESKPKYCGILEVKNDECRLVPRKLLTIRPFVFDDLCLDDHFEHDIDIQDIDDFLKDKIKTMIMTAEEENPPISQLHDQHLSFITNYTAAELDDNENDNESKCDLSRLPIIRLRVDHTHFPKIRSARFGQNFLNKVANPDEILLFHKKSARKEVEGDGDGEERQMRGGNLFAFSHGADTTHNIEDIVTANITSESAEALTIFAELDLLKAIQEFVDKEDPHCIEEFCDARLDAIAGKLIESECVGESAEIMKQSAHITNNRRVILRQQRNMQLLEKEEEEGKNDKLESDVMDIDEVKQMAKRNVKEKEKEHGDEVVLVKKKKANLHSFGYGNASQKARDNIVNSQVENEEDSDDEPRRKKSKLCEDKSKSNDVLNSLLGFDDSDLDEDIDEDVDMSSSVNRNNRNNRNHNKSNRVLRSQRNSGNTQHSLDNFGISAICHSQKSVINRRGTQRNTQNTQNADEDDEASQNQRKRRQKRSTKATGNAWGSLLSRRSKR